MKRREVTTLEVFVTGMIIVAACVLLYESISYSIRKYRANKEISRIDQVNAPAVELCDHGSSCSFKKHCDHMWCDQHKMYHHRDRMCMHNVDLEKLEDILIKDREKELGIKRPSIPIKYNPDLEFNKRR